MNILKEVLSELLSMFVADARPTAAILVIVAVAALLINATSLPTLAWGVILLVGCVIVLFLSVRREAARRATHSPES